MPTFDGFLIRDTLNDSGQVPSPGNPFSSPDMICSKQVADPGTFFKNNYDKDPNINYEFGQNNYVYVRAKNLHSESESGTMSCYYCKTSLVMHPDQWKDNTLKTYEGVAHTNLPVTEAGEVTVGEKPFIWNPPAVGRSYCMVGMVRTADKPNPIPDNAEVNTWNGFITWVRTNRDVCFRNLTIVNKMPDPTYSQVSFVQNIEDTQVPILVQVIASSEIPAGTKIQLGCDPLWQNPLEYTVEEDKRTVTASAILPADFEGYIDTKAFLPEGGEWPRGGTIETKLFLGVGAESPLIQHSVHWALLGTAHCEHDVMAIGAAGRLVEIGNVLMKFNEGV